jgi:phenylalanyl-tRNA synthetase beta chain
VHIFESGRIFAPTDGVLPDETTHVGVLVHGAWEGDCWLHSNLSVDYYLAKGLVQRLCRAFGVVLEYLPTDEPFLHPGKSAAVRDVQGRAVGWLGEVHPLVLQAYDLRSPAVAVELDLDVLLDSAVEVPAFRDLLAYPAVEQDLAVVVDSSVLSAQVVESLRKAGGSLLENVTVFDLYEGAQVGAGKKSLALRLSFRAVDRTLNESEVTNIRSRMLKELKQAVGGELRA